MSTVEQDLREHELLEDAETEREDEINGIADEMQGKLIMAVEIELISSGILNRNATIDSLLDNVGHSYYDIFSFLLSRDGEDFFNAMVFDDFSERSELEIATDIADQVNFDAAATAEYERRVEEAKTNAAEDKARMMEDSYHE